MRFTGSFINLKGSSVGLDIIIPDDTATDGIGQTILIEPDGILEFASEDTIVTECGSDDWTDTVIMHSCTIRLHAAYYIPELFTYGVRQAAVRVTLNSKPVFCGYLTPRTYNQPFNEVYDDLELNAVDCLSALDSLPYKGIGSNGVSWKDAVAIAGSSTFAQLLKQAIDVAVGNPYTDTDAAYVDEKTAGQWKAEWPDGFACYWDASRATEESAEPAALWQSLSVNDRVWLGDDEDKVMTWRDVLEQLLRYLGLHITQHGDAFYIFSWASMRLGNTAWARLTFISSEGGASALPIPAEPVQLTTDVVEDDQAQVDIQEAYNLIKAKVTVTAVDEAVSSPFDDDQLTPAFDYKSLMAVEYSYDVTGKEYEATPAFALLINNKFGLDGKDLTSDFTAAAHYIEHRLRVMHHSLWTFGRDGVDWADNAAKLNPTQAQLINRLRNERAALLLQMDTTDIQVATEGKIQKLSIPEKSDPHYSLVLSVNGKGSTNFNSTPDVYTPSQQDGGIMPELPVAVCRSAGSSMWSPSTEGMTNYLLITGRIRLGRIMHTPGISGISETPSTKVNVEGATADDDVSIEELRQVLQVKETAGQRGTTISPVLPASSVNLFSVPSTGSTGKRYIAMEWYDDSTQDAQRDAPDGTISGKSTPHPEWTAANHFMPFDNDGLTPAPDNIKLADGIQERSVPVLALMLTIGSKVLVGTDNGNGRPTLSNLKWRPFVTLDKCEEKAQALIEQAGSSGRSASGTYNDPDFGAVAVSATTDKDVLAHQLFYSQSFLIGFKAKGGDKLVEEDHDIECNFSFRDNIGQDKGFAIPLPYDEELSGEVRLDILCVARTYLSTELDGVSCSWPWRRQQRTGGNMVYTRADVPGADDYPLLDNIRAVFIKDFKIKVCSDTGTSSSNSGDVIYVSRTDERYTNEKDDIDLDIHSGFTESEVKKYGLDSSVALSTVLCDGKAVLSIRDIPRAETAKPEALIVDETWNELHVGRLCLEQNLQDDGSVSPFARYIHPAIRRSTDAATGAASTGLILYPFRFERNLMEGSAAVKLKEVYK